jgi:murein DD-endopeptidase MepM/ murein hydrolase activator NlpD
MLPPHPEAATKPGRGWGLPLLALVLTVGVVVPLSAPAAVAERPSPPPTTRPDPARVPPLWMPVAGAVVRGFDARAGPYGPGHRGIDIAAPVGEVVRAPAAGRTVFAGPVAGTTWVSILVAPGVTVTLGPLLDQLATAGGVRSRAPVGRVALGHGANLHLSVRVDGEYVDPLGYLVDRPRARLAPLLAPGGLAAVE